jgi:hypothetical protein
MVQVLTEVSLKFMRFVPIKSWIAGGFISGLPELQWFATAKL